MKVISFLKTTVSSLSSSVKRFTLALLFSTGIFASLVAISEKNIKSSYSASTESLERLAMTLFIGFLLSLCVDLFFENKKSLPLYYKLGAYIISILFVTSFYFYWLKDLSFQATSQYIGLAIALVFTAFLLPNINKEKRIEKYSIKVIGRFFISYIYTLVLALGLNAIIFALEQLLNVPIYSQLYYYVFLFSGLVFAPAFFLGGIPKDSDNFNSYTYPYFLKILILYIVMPLASIYLGILYIYFAKIIITRTWPIGLVSHLVVWFSTLCVVLMFFTQPIKEDKWASIFRSYMPKLIIPILAMMFLSMGIRIRSYGITENRYYVLLLGLWILFTMLYFIFFKNINTRILPLSLSLLCIFALYSPINSFTIAKNSQNKRLDSILAKDTKNSDDQREINNILTYFDDYHSLANVKALPEDFKLSQTEEVFGFKYERYNPYISDSVFYDSEEAPQIIDISSYDYYFKADYDSKTIEEGNISINYDYQQGLIEISLDSKLVASLDFTDFIKTINENYPNQSTIPSKDMTFLVDNEFIRAKTIFTYLGGSKDNDLVNYEHGEFILLLDIK